MFFKEYLKQYSDFDIKIFVDMDGVIADYIFEEAFNFDKKRPLFDSIKKLEEISKMSNVELFIFSATKFNEGVSEKNGWLDKYAPFFSKENRIIISREANNMEESAILKANYITDFKRDGSKIMIIDDDPKILKEIRKSNKDVILLKDTVLVD